MLMGLVQSWEGEPLHNNGNSVTYMTPFIRACEIQNFEHFQPAATKKKKKKEKKERKKDNASRSCMLLQDKELALHTTCHSSSATKCTSSKIWKRFWSFSARIGQRSGKARPGVKLENLHKKVLWCWCYNFHRNACCPFTPFTETQYLQKVFSTII